MKLCIQVIAAKSIHKSIADNFHKIFAKVSALASSILSAISISTDVADNIYKYR